MNQREWMTCDDPVAMVGTLTKSGIATDQQWLQFVVACCRHHEDVLNTKSLSALAAVEQRLVSGVWTKGIRFQAYDHAEEGFELACEEANYYDNPYGVDSPPEVRWAGLVGGSVEENPIDVAARAVTILGRQDRERACQMLRDIFDSPPFKILPTIPPK